MRTKGTDPYRHQETNMNLYLIRHAQPDYENDTITETGRDQAKYLGEWMKDIKIDEIYHSSMGRAKITASYIAEKQNIPMVSVDWARELSWGNAKGDAGDSLSPWAIKDKIIETNHSYPEGEEWKKLPDLQDSNLISSIENLQKNFDTFLAEHGCVRENQFYRVIKPNDKNIVLVCHGGVISALISYLINVPFFQYISHLGVDLTSVTKIHFSNKKDAVEPAKLIYVNNHVHLGVK